MSPTPSSSRRDDDAGSASIANKDPNPPTIASFSPVTLSHAPSANKQRSTILVHQKSPLLIATPPQITRALAYSHPFLLPLNQLVGLLTWTSGDPWESFLLVAGFWGVVLYGDVVMRLAGPVVVVMGLILGMYSRRYSPLSSTGWTGEKQKKGDKKVDSEATNIKHQKTLDEIVETLKVFTSRSDGHIRYNGAGSYDSPYKNTSRHSIMDSSDPPTYTNNYHETNCPIDRDDLLDLAFSAKQGNEDHTLEISFNPSIGAVQMAASAAARRRPDATGVRFTFILYENQRRWVGLGWTTSLFAYERAPWTDEHLNPAPTKEEFELPDVEGGVAQWRWVEGSHWLVEGAAETDEGGTKAKSDTLDGGQGWIYYDNKWQAGRRGVDGWGRYTRRRKWYRDAELVEASPNTKISPSHTPSQTPVSTPPPSVSRTPTATTSHTNYTPPPPPDFATDTASIRSKHSRTSNYSASTHSQETSSVTSTGGMYKSGPARRKCTESSQMSGKGIRKGDEDHAGEPARMREVDGWGIGDDVRMGLE
ncbi:hypothetical protein B2J93_3495 [Marssonina coronariae]|uniref:Peroxin/Ferlin domain-containing protein n=1 Tax=Diplocarpon coronariae TaxID=2795749 RepID=A0A218Z6Q7_9HELO|nr:hypothetical protein B2J93_3495 [Marssonina coronariae]